MNLRSSEQYIFLPPRQGGLLFQLGLILILLGGSAMGLYLASQAQIGPVFLLSLLPGLAAVILVPILVYQLYCLQTAFYTLERDGLSLHWGLRIEDIPMNTILWVQRQEEFTQPLPLPVIRYPGALVGARRRSNIARSSGPEMIEYMASKGRGLVLVGTTERIFAISPREADRFLYTFQRLTELGSLTPLPHRSVYPTFLLSRVWSSPLARLLSLASLALSLALLIWVGMTIPGRSQVNLGFYPDGSPGDATPAIQLLLLPVINSLIVLVDLFIGLFFFRRKETQDLSYLVWACGSFIPLLFLLGAFFILHSS